MFILVLLVSFFTQLKGSEIMVVSLENFLKGTSARLSSMSFRYTADDHRENLVPVHVKSSEILPDSRHIADPSVVVNMLMVNDPEHLLPDSIPPGKGKTSANGSIIARRPITSSHPVVIYNNDICFKQWPDIPGHDACARKIFSTIFPKVSSKDIPFPECEVLLINKIAYSVSKFIDGRPFGEILRKVEENPTIAPSYTFSLEELQRLFLFCFLTAPEDCHKNNCLIKKSPHSDRSQVRLIDFEKSFGKMIADGTRVHCVLFCFHEALSKPIAEGVYQELIASEDSILYTWIVWSGENGYQTALAKIAGYKRYRKPPGQGLYTRFKRLVECLSAKIAGYTCIDTVIGIPIDTSAIQGMYARFQGLIERATADRNQSLASIFAAVSPILNDIYKFREYVVPSPPEPEMLAIAKRIKDIDGTRGSGPTPKSAYAPLERYIGSGEHNPTAILSAVERLAYCQI